MPFRLNLELVRELVVGVLIGVVAYFMIFAGDLTSTGPTTSATAESIPTTPGPEEVDAVLTVLGAGAGDDPLGVVPGHRAGHQDLRTRHDR